MYIPSISGHILVEGVIVDIFFQSMYNIFV